VPEFSLHAPCATGLNGHGERQPIDDDAASVLALHVGDNQGILNFRSQLHSFPLSVDQHPALVFDFLRSQ
jgi:hypothetical protein